MENDRPSHGFVAGDGEVRGGETVLNSQRVTQRTITKSKFSLEINGPMLVGTSTCSIGTVWATKIGIASLARFRLDESRLHQY